MVEQTQSNEAKRPASEISALEKFALRWSVLAAWNEQLHGRRVALTGLPAAKLEEARIKLSSGCFSSCEVGCVLSEAEAELVSADGSSPDCRVDFWLELLGQAMSETPETERLLRVPSVKIHYQTCGFGSCKCGG